jgi:NAD(P)-dependent dehydrogenase (short-subunit alcohol dehydrogenase family)
MILITGATGKTGRALVERLASRGVPVRTLVRDLARAGGPAAPGVEIVVGEVAGSVLLSMGLPAWYVDGLIELYGFYSSGAGSVVTDAVRRLAGHPGRSFAQFAGDYRAVFGVRSQPHEATLEHTSQ